MPSQKHCHQQRGQGTHHIRGRRHILLPSRTKNRQSNHPPAQDKETSTYRRSYHKIIIKRQLRRTLRPRLNPNPKKRTQNLQRNRQRVKHIQQRNLGLSQVLLTQWLSGIRSHDDRWACRRKYLPRFFVPRAGAFQHNGTAFKQVSAPTIY